MTICDIVGIQIIPCPFLPRGRAYLMRPSGNRVVLNSDDALMPDDEIAHLPVVEIRGLDDLHQLRLGLPYGL